ncbi:MAG: hypothetical protein WC783_01070 [Candidatus Paceibacterota bacterium]|jgi:hypothetical protein
MALLLDVTGSELYDLIVGPSGYESTPGLRAAKYSKVGSDMVLTGIGSAALFEAAGYDGAFGLTENDRISFGFIFTVDAIASPIDVAYSLLGLSNSNIDFNALWVGTVHNNLNAFPRLSETNDVGVGNNTSGSIFTPPELIGVRLKLVLKFIPNAGMISYLYFDGADDFSIQSNMTDLPVYTHNLNMIAVGWANWGGTPGFSTMDYTVHRAWVSKDYSVDPEWLAKPIIDIGTTKDYWTGAEFYNALNIDAPPGTIAAHFSESSPNMLVSDFPNAVSEVVGYDYGVLQYAKTDKFSFGVRFTITSLTAGLKFNYLSFAASLLNGIYTYMYLDDGSTLTGGWVIGGIVTGDLSSSLMPINILNKELKILCEFNSIVNGAVSFTYFYDDMTTPIYREFVNVSDLVDDNFQTLCVMGALLAGATGSDLTYHSFWIGDGGYLDEPTVPPSSLYGFKIFGIDLDNTSAQIVFEGLEGQVTFDVPVLTTWGSANVVFIDRTLIPAGSSGLYNIYYENLVDGKTSNKVNVTL